MTRKIFVCLIISLMLISVASANVQRFNNLSVNVPNNWSAEQKNETVTLRSNNSGASMEIFLAKLGENNLSDVVEKLYIEREGVDLEEDDDGDYSFSFKNSSGTESIALITGTDDYYLCISMTGFEDENIQGDLEAILTSIDWDNK